MYFLISKSCLSYKKNFLKQGWWPFEWNLEYEGAFQEVKKQLLQTPALALPDLATQTRRTYPRESWQIDFTVMLSPEQFQVSLGASRQVFQEGRSIKLKKIGLSCFWLPCSTRASPMA